MSSQLKDDLDRTYLELELNGWCQMDGTGDEICVEEAAALAVGRPARDWTRRDDPRHNAVLRALLVQLHPGHEEYWRSTSDVSLTLWGWNDKPDRTADEVKALIKAAWEVA